MSKTDEEIKKDLERNKQLQERKNHIAGLRFDIEVLRLEDEHFRLRRNIYENQMFFKRIDYENMLQELSRHNNIPIEDVKKMSQVEINKLVVEYQREMEKRETDAKLKLSTDKGDKGDAPADSEKVPFPEEEIVKENNGVTDSNT